MIDTSSKNLDLLKDYLQGLKLNNPLDILIQQSIYPEIEGWEDGDEEDQNTIAEFLEQVMGDTITNFGYDPYLLINGRQSYRTDFGGFPYTMKEYRKFLSNHFKIA